MTPPMPDWKREVHARLAGAGLRPEREREVVEEFAQHLEDRYRDLIGRGVPEVDAIAETRRELDAARFDRDIARAVLDPPSAPPPPHVDGLPARQWVSGLWQDLRYAARALRRTPGFLIAAAATVALSTGPTIAAIGVANWLFFRPLPGVLAPERMAVVWFGTWSEEGSFSPSRVSYAHLADMRARFTTIDAITGHTSSSVNLALDTAAPRVAAGWFVMANFFDVLGVRFQEGRGFRPEEDWSPGGESVVVLSADLARSLFPGRPAVGRIVRVNGLAFQVVGVTSPSFRGSVLGRPADLWLPGLTSPRVHHFPPGSQAYGPERGPFSDFLVRLSPGATFDQADAELRAAARALGDRETPETVKYRTVQPTLFPEAGLDPFARRIGWSFTRLLLGIGALLVVLGAANLANLFVFRSVTRGQEAAVRRALGASGGQLVRLQLAESVLVSGIGALAGLGVAVAGKAWLDGAMVPGIGRFEIAIDWRLLAIAIAMAAGVGILLSAAPARIAARTTLTGDLSRTSRSATRSTGRLRTSLAVVQLALSLMLLVGALLFIQTLRNLRHVDLGIDPRGVSTFRFASRGQAYTPERTLQFYRDLLERLPHAPGVEAVAAANLVPVEGVTYGLRVLPPAEAASTIGKPNREAFQAALSVLSNEVTPAYFRAIGMQIIAGRTFTDAETYITGVEPGVVISASLAERLYGTTNAVGRLVTFPAQGGLPRHDAPVIGVVSDVRWGSPSRPIEHLIYLPFGGAATSVNQVLIVRSSRPAAEVTRLIEAHVSRLDPALPVARDQTMTAILDQQLAQQRVNAWALGVLAGLGFLLAAVGIHGLVAQIAGDRRREFGIRLALGATPWQIILLVLRTALFVIAIGAPLGLVLAGLGSQLVKSRLFGITPLDLAVYIVATLALAAVVVLASLGPARRASRVDPVNVLRVD